jgi:hypothetical protein
MFLCTAKCLVGKAATKIVKSGIYRRGAEYAEIFLFQTLLCALSASAVRSPGNLRNMDVSRGILANLMPAIHDEDLHFYAP